jgi:hypothetical protein
MEDAADASLNTLQKAIREWRLSPEFTGNGPLQGLRTALHDTRIEH